MEMDHLPHHFCWTRFGTEASQTIAQILSRKEQERQANGGMFFWGIGNAIGPSMKHLVRLDEAPQVIFSPIKARPKPADVSPEAVVAWTAATGIFGERFEIPTSALITSRYDPENPRPYHYALVCHQHAPLALSDSQFLYAEGLRNILTGRSVGASQVTAVVNRTTARQLASAYAVALQARLVAPYLIRLSDPLIVPAHTLRTLGECDLAEVVRQHRETKTVRAYQVSLSMSAS